MLKYSGWSDCWLTCVTLGTMAGRTKSLSAPHRHLTGGQCPTGQVCASSGAQLGILSCLALADILLRATYA